MPADRDLADFLAAGPPSAERLKDLFLDRLGWDEAGGPLSLDAGKAGGGKVTLTPVAEKRGFVALHHAAGAPPDRQTRTAIDRAATRVHAEHLTVFTDAAGGQIWRWIKRRSGEPDRPREHRLSPDPTPAEAELLAGKLAALKFRVEEEGTLDTLAAAGRVAAALDTEKVTKKFYGAFQDRLKEFQGFIDGVARLVDREWYASLMLNRLMFTYFLQKKGFLGVTDRGGDTDYLNTRMEMVRDRGDTFHSFYRTFLLRLFHDGLGKPDGTHTAAERDELRDLIGKVPYLNGGLFEVHAIEEAHPDIHIPDEAFERLLDFFGEWDWHLDDRPGTARTPTDGSRGTINPDVLGYIFEKYINQKQMGAYYTKEDVTGYICRSTIVPWVLDEAERRCAVAFDPGGPVWRLLKDDPDRYLFPSLSHGVLNDGDVVPLPDDIAAGLDDVTKRDGWDEKAPAAFALPTETWREHVARRKRCLAVRDELASGTIASADRLVTLNVDVRRFLQDVITNAEGPDLLRAIHRALVGGPPGVTDDGEREPGISVLDPACGSGAFLFAALKVLESPLRGVLEAMEQLVADQDALGRPHALPDFRALLADRDDTNRHPSQEYHAQKTIVLGGLFGVDLMPEAVEICKLRLFLQLAAQVEPAPDHANLGVEPLPDLDFNVRAGNSLVGFADEAAVKRSAAFTGRQAKFAAFDAEDLQAIRDRAAEVDDRYRAFRRVQADPAADHATQKTALKDALDGLNGVLTRYLARDYGIETADAKPGDNAGHRALIEWNDAHRPLHWFAEFYGTMRRGGFDVVIGNPPYVRTSKIDYEIKWTAGKQRDIYAEFLLRSLPLAADDGRIGMIVPLSLCFSKDFRELRGRLLDDRPGSLFSSFDNIPAAVFSGVSQRCTVWIAPPGDGEPAATGLRRWRSAFRPHLVDTLKYHSVGEVPDLEDSIPRVFDASASPFCDRQQADRTDRFGKRQPGGSIGYSPSARNFLSSYIAAPPTVDAKSKAEVASNSPSEQVLPEDLDKAAALGALAGDACFAYWLVWGDGFHVTSANVAGFLDWFAERCSTAFPAAERTGELLAANANRFLAFKKNAGKYVGNYNFGPARDLTRSLDLTLLNSAGVPFAEAVTLFDALDRLAAVNAMAGEKNIPGWLKARYPVPAGAAAKEAALAADLRSALAAAGYAPRPHLDALTLYPGPNTD